MKEIRTCSDCDHCLPIGEGDFICDEHPGSLVLEDYGPGEDFLICEGKDFEEK